MSKVPSFKRVNLKKEKEVRLGDHEVLMSFYDDSGAECFEEWWNDSGAQLFAQWIFKKRPDHTHLLTE